MRKSDAVVFVVDDDKSVRKLIANLLSFAGYRVEAFDSAQNFLDESHPAALSCLVLDLKLPGLNGLELQEELLKRGKPLPIVFITGYGDIPTTVKAMKAGAVDFLAKPFTDEALLSAVRNALERSRKEGAVQSKLGVIQALLAKLSPREA